MSERKDVFARPDAAFSIRRWAVLRPCNMQLFGSFHCRAGSPKAHLVYLQQESYDSAISGLE